MVSHTRDDNLHCRNFISRDTSQTVGRKTSSIAYASRNCLVHCCCLAAGNQTDRVLVGSAPWWVSKWLPYWFASDISGEGKSPEPRTGNNESRNEDLLWFHSFLFHRFSTPFVYISQSSFSHNLFSNHFYFPFPSTSYEFSFFPFLLLFLTILFSWVTFILFHPCGLIFIIFFLNSVILFFHDFSLLLSSYYSSSSFIVSFSYSSMSFSLVALEVFTTVTIKNVVFLDWRRVDLVITDVSEQLVAYILRTKESTGEEKR